jgi:hypothetical protein
MGFVIRASAAYASDEDSSSSSLLSSLITRIIIIIISGGGGGGGGIAQLAHTRTKNQQREAAAENKPETGSSGSGVSKFQI